MFIYIYIYIYNWFIAQASSMGKFNWGVCYVIIFLQVQFWIRLAAVSYHGMEVHTMASPTVKSVDKSHDPKIASKTSHSMRPVSFSSLVYITKPRKLIPCDLLWQITRNYNRLDGGHGCGTGHRMMAVLGMAGDYGDNPWTFRNHVIV